MKETKSELNRNIVELVHKFEQAYALNNEPIRIDFRKLCPNLNKLDRYTHLIHPYPAKLIPHIPYFFLSTDYFCPQGGVVLDPFCGSGTVLLEAQLAGRKALGADANPLAVRISQVKTQKQDVCLLQKELHLLLERARNMQNDTGDTDLHDMAFWYSVNSYEQLNNLREQISKVDNLHARTFFEVCLSSISKKVSVADPSISVPVRLNPERFHNYPSRYQEALQHLEQVRNVDVLDKFRQTCECNIERMKTLSVIKHLPNARVISDDARNITTGLNSKRKLPRESVDMIITSPPYAGAQKYIRSSRLGLYWMGVQTTEEIHRLNDKNIGREDYRKGDLRDITTGIEAADIVLHQMYKEGHKERAHIVGNYLLEMEAALDESCRVLKKEGYMIIVIGNNTVCGRPFDTQDYLTTYLRNKGMCLQFKLIDDIKSYGLMTKRNKTASRISREWVLVFKKE